MSNFLPQLAVPKPPLRDQVYAVLKEAILSGKFKPEHRMMEQEIATSMGQSRSPVREAFRRLEQEGYLLATRSGIVVQPISPRDVEDLYFLRERLEGIAAALGAKRANVPLHHRGRAVLEEHRRCVDAIASHDEIAAEHAAREHVRNAWEHAHKHLAPSEPDR